jgi:hypothetical protein
MWSKIMSVTVKDLTSGEVAGTGFFDELMRTSKAHLVQEYDAGRLVGTDYSNAYVGAYQFNLQTASQFILQYQMTNQQILVLQEQVKQAQKQNELLDLQKLQAQIGIDTAQYNLDLMLPAQLLQTEAQTVLLGKQALESDKQVILLAQQNLQAIAQTAMIGTQEDLLDKQILTETANTETPTAGLTLVEYEKKEQETAILTAKVETEKAQTQDLIGLANDVDVGGLVGMEIKLKESQGDSFLRDAEQKAAKFFADSFSVGYATTPENLSYIADTWHLGARESQIAITALMKGVDDSYIAP